MLRLKRDGTQKWCPKCGEITVCKAVNPSRIAGESGQRWYKIVHRDICWFRRGLICKSCGHEWLTAEIKEKFLDELVELRNALKEIKDNAEQYIKESDRASKSLKKLSSSLGSLRALKVYKEQE